MPAKGPPTAEELFEPPQFAKKTKDPDVVMQAPYHCHCTYKEFPEQKGHFFQVGGELFAANNGYFPVSKDAIEGYFQHIVQQTGDQRIALHRVAQYLDLYVNDEIIDMMLSAPDGNITVGKFAQRCRMKQYAGKTYLDTMLEGGAPGGKAAEIPDGLQDAANTEIDPRAVELFGIGYEPDDYRFLLQHYEMLTKQFSSADSVQDSMIRDLCTTKLMQMRSRSDPDAYAKMTKLYQDTLKNSGLQTRNSDDSADDDKACFGVWKAQIEQYCPADIYLNDKLFDDVDSVRDYFERFIKRPVINFFSGRKEMDPDYSLTEEEKSGNG